ncbi:MAG: capsule biosynthesis protein [Helicobacter sp.]|nr:capsule biosynthesis protein [Helicobacter sp.]
MYEILKDKILQCKNFLYNFDYRKITSPKALGAVMLVVIVYYLLFAADRYVSSIFLSVRSTTENATSSMTGLVSLLGNNANSKEDIKYLKAYIQSLDMLKILEEKINLRELYAKQKKDLFFRTHRWYSQEDFLEYYQRLVGVTFDNDTGLLNVEVQGFNPEDTYLIAQTILEECDHFINELSHANAREQMAFAESELNQFKERYQKAKDDLLIFQNQYGVFDPLKQAEARASLNTQLEGKISQKETELTTMRSYLNETAPQIVMLKSEIAALNKQLNKDTKRITSGQDSQKLNDLAAKFQDLTIQVSFAEDAYTAALRTLETTRIDAFRKIKQLVVIQKPTIPESPKYPERLYNIFTIFVILVLIFGSVRLIYTIIEEHRY